MLVTNVLKKVNLTCLLRRRQAIHYDSSKTGDDRDVIWASNALMEMVEENGVQDPLSETDNGTITVTSVQNSSSPQLITATNIVHLTLPNQVQSVIQPTQQSVIQTASNLQPMLTKGNVIIVKPNSVIQTAQGLQTIQVKQLVETSEDSFSDEETTTKKMRDKLTRRPSYRKILNDLGGTEIAVGKVESSSECDSNYDNEFSRHNLRDMPTHYQTVIPAGAIQIASQNENVPGLHTLTMSNATSGGTIVQYANQDGQFYVPVVTSQGGSISGGSGNGGEEDVSRKREMRLMKNREAARECRRKKKEYIKCLENRVAVLETQNKALIDELKSLKELYCKTKIE